MLSYSFKIHERHQKINRVTNFQDFFSKINPAFHEFGKPRLVTLFFTTDYYFDCLCIFISYLTAHNLKLLNQSKEKFSNVLDFDGQTGILSSCLMLLKYQRNSEKHFHFWFIHNVISILVIFDPIHQTILIIITLSEKC